jgi:hypothetical protein
MPHTRVWMVLMALVLVVSSLSSAQTTAQTSRPRAQKIPPKQAQLPPPPVGPLSQIPMDQIPPAPPHVSYQHELLTIVAQNSTLAAILVDVRKLTGASIDVPPNATERVVTRLGPGPVRDVLAGLLNGTRFNYVMIGSPKDPAALSALLLTAKPADGGTTPNAPVAMVDQSTPAFPPEPVPPPVVAQVGPTIPEADADAEDKDSENDSEDAQATGDQVAADQAAGQQEETDEQRQQRFDKLKAPPNAPQAPVIPRPDPSTPPQ